MGGSVDQGGAPTGENGDHKRAVIKRPLVPLVLALMVGLAAAAWGVNIPRTWLLASMAALLVIMLLLFLGQAPPSSNQSTPDSPKEKPPLPEKDHPR
jgi:hypothetical protein